MNKIFHIRNLGTECFHEFHQNIYTFMANPDWAINLFDRSETFVDFLRRNAMSTSASISNFRQMIRNDLTTSDPPPEGSLYRSLNHCLASNFTEGCAIGGGLSVLVSVVPPLLKGNLRRAVNDVPTLGNLRVALFFGSLMSICNGSQYISRRKLDNDNATAVERVKLRLLLGFLSGLSVSVLPKGVRRFILYFLLTRAIEIAARLGKIEYRRRRAESELKEAIVNIEEVSSDASTVSPTVPFCDSAELFSSHEVVGLASVSMTVIITAWFRFTELVPHGYLHFLAGINNLTTANVDDIQHILRGDKNFKPEVTKVVLREKRMCSVYHPEDQGCLSFYVRFLLKGIVTKTGPFYLKLYLLPLVFSIVKRKHVSAELALNFFKRVWWSSLFLATMNATAAGTVCAMGHLRPLSYHPSIPLTSHASLGGYMCGLSLYLEQDSRRLELALYLFGQAIQIMVNAYKAASLWYPRGTDTIATSASITMMLLAFWLQADPIGSVDFSSIIRPGYAGMMARIIDTPTRRHSFRLL